MKKLFISLLSVVLLGFAGIASAYTVVSGDTMWEIAQKEKISLYELIKNNPHIKNPDFIVPGDHLNTGKMWIPELYPTNEDLLGAVTSPIAGVTYSIAGSGITSSATSITLASLTIPQTGYELVDSDFSDTFYITLEPGNTKKQEIASCTTVVQNANNTATLSGCSRGLTPFTPFTASTTYAFAHGGGTTVIFSDPPQLFNEFTAKGNAEVISAVWRFDQYPTASTTLGNATTSRQFITLGQANAIGNQGAATSTETVAGIAELATQIEMASGTDRGANDPLVLQAKYATSTCQITGLFTVVTDNDGKIVSNCIDKTENYAWTGTHTFNGSGFSTTSLANGIVQASSTGKIESNWIDDKFGGNGEDGALSVTALTTTTINAASASIVIKNYTSLNIPATAGLTMSNPHTNGTLLVIKVSGDATIAGTIDLTGMGATFQNNGALILDDSDHFGASATGGAVLSNKFLYTSSSTARLSRGGVYLACGSGGGTAQGGNGGGCFILQVKGTLTFTGSIYLDGAAGTTSATPSNPGGGGGSAGMAVVLYNYAGSLSGTIYARGGAGGNGAACNNCGTTPSSAGGGGAGSYSSAGGAGGAAVNANNNGLPGTVGNLGAGSGGGSGGSSTGPAQTGGAGAAQGTSNPNHYLVAKNYWFF